MERYKRQIKLKEVGENGQKLINDSKVLVVGVGGLGCAILPYLISAGIGKIGIADGDLVEITNLSRQVIFNESSVGLHKVDEALNSLKNLNSECEIVKYQNYITNKNILKIFNLYDIIIDATDSLELRYLINDACVVLGKPFIYGSVHKYQGQVSTFNYKNGPTYRCLYPNQNAVIENCDEAGVMGTTVGLIGMIQANELMKLILKKGDNLSGKLLLYDSLNYKQEIYNFSKNKNILVNKSQFSIHLNNKINNINFKEALNYRNSIFLDVRESNEIPKIVKNDFVNIPLSELKEKINLLNSKTWIMIFCQTGKRSILAKRILDDNDFLKLKLINEGAKEISQLIEKNKK